MAEDALDVAEERRAIRAAIQGLTEQVRAIERRLARLRKAQERQAVFEEANELAGTLRQLADWTSDLRAQAVAEIWQAEELSLAGLAKRIGVSKTRASQFVSAQKRKEGEEDHEHGTNDGPR